MFGILSVREKNAKLRDENSLLKGKLIRAQREKMELEHAQDTTLERTIYCLPQGVIMKRIYSRTSGNNWVVRANVYGTEYYGVTLEEALAKLFRLNTKVAKKYQDNLDAQAQEQK